MAIGHIQKPSMVNVQSRVLHGSSSQTLVIEELRKLSKLNNMRPRLISFADIGSNSPDVIMSFNRNRYQFEIKNTHNDVSPVTLLDKSISRGKKIPEELDYLARMFAILDKQLHRKMHEANYSFDFMGILDFIKDNMEPDSGMAEDPHTVKSGKMPNFFKTENPLMLDIVRAFIIDTLVSNGNDYLVIFNKKTDKMAMFNTGRKENIFSCQDIPKLKKFFLTTYGGSESQSTRIGLKVQFEKLF